MSNDSKFNLGDWGFDFLDSPGTLNSAEKSADSDDPTKTTQSELDNDEKDIIDPEDLKNKLDGDDDGADGDDSIEDGKVVENDDGGDDVDNDNTPHIDNDDDDDSDSKTSDDLSDIEGDLVELINERLNNKFDLGEDAPKTIDEFVEMFDKLAEESSMPQYPSEEMEDLHNFVSQGGDLKSYLETKYSGGIDLDTIDIEKESNQKLLVTELLKAKGYSDDKINRTLNRYEEAGVLDEEAEDAKDILKGLREKESKKLLAEQEKAHSAQLEQQQKFITNVREKIDKIDNIRGITLSAKERKELNDYIFKPDQDGVTPYQKEYQKDLVSNLIESAYFTMKKDALVKQIEKKAESNAARRIKSKLAQGTKRASTNAQRAPRKGSAFDQFYKTVGV